MNIRRFASGWRTLVLGAATFAVFVPSLVSPPPVLSQDRDLHDGGPAEYAAVDFAEWFNPIDPSEDTGPLIVCYDGTRPPTDAFIEALNEQLYNAGRLAESYHLYFPDGQYLPNRHELPLGIGQPGQDAGAIQFTWWEYDGDGSDDGGGGDSRYYLGNRWSGTQGSPRALTWSLVKDGTIIPGAAGEASTPSELFSRMDSLYSSQGGRATWVLRVQQCFDRWAAISGLSFTRVVQPPNGDGNNDDDDGAAFSSSAGAAGLRGDIRISMHNIDGVNGILAYTFFPSNGDMVFDRSETNFGSSGSLNRFFRNTLMHESGHAFGIDHVCSTTAAFLMEPLLGTSFDGPQHDDIRAVHRHYGDNEETDNTTGTATSLGTIPVGATNNTVCNLPPPVNGTNPTNTSGCSMDADAEQDYFSFAVTTSCAASITVTPLGFSYADNAQNLNGTCQTGTTTDSLTRANLAVQLIGTNGTTVLATASGAAAGVAEVISSSPLAAAGTYFIRVFESAAQTQTQLYSLSVSISSTGCTGPTVTSHPSSETICVNDSVTFTVAASGTAPLSYQWRKDFVNIPGQTGTSYTIASIVEGDEGDYDCVVTNSCGSDISNVATLDVIDDPVIAQDPTDQSVAVGATVQFSVISDGTLFQWRRNGIPLSDGGNISGANTEVLEITNVQPADAGNYSVDVQNGCGAVTSAIAVLSICSNTSVVTPPADVTVCEGEPATFTVVADGSPPLAYQWRRNGTPIDGATSDTYTIAATSALDAGDYDVQVSNDCSSETSASAALVVNVAPSITADPGSATVAAGTNVFFSVGATGSGTLSYQWRKNGSPLADGGNISGATTATLAVNNVQESDEGSYACDVSNSCGLVTSNAATLTVDDEGAPCPGDFNNDNVIDLGDLTIILSNYGMSGATAEQGDLNGDTIIDLNDLTAFLALFGSPCP